LKLDRLLETLGPAALAGAAFLCDFPAGEIGSVIVAQILRFSRGPASRRREQDRDPCLAKIHPSSYGRCGKRRLGFDQSLLFKLGPEFRGDFALQRIVVLRHLLVASRPDDKSDRDIWRCRELKRSGS
jgi:hypothetical protein